MSHSSNCPDEQRRQGGSRCSTILAVDTKLLSGLGKTRLVSILLWLAAGLGNRELKKLVLLAQSYTDSPIDTHSQGSAVSRVDRK